MPAWEALLALVTLLKSIPLNVVAQDHIGLRRPNSTRDLPRVAVSASDVQHSLAGIGGVVGSHQVTNTAWATETGTRTSGTLTIELWADDEAILTNLATAVLDKLQDSLAAGGAGFGRLAARSVGPMETAILPGQQPGGATGLRLPIGCVFGFEAVTPTQTGPDGIIRHVHADVHQLESNDVNEAMDLP